MSVAAPARPLLPTAEDRARKEELLRRLHAAAAEGAHGRCLFLDMDNGHKGYVVNIPSYMVNIPSYMVNS